MGRSFEQSLNAYRQQLVNNRRLSDRLRLKIGQLVTDNPTEPRAWVLYNQVVCLTGGAEYESPGILHNAAHRFGDSFSGETAVEMRYHSIIGMARDADRTADPDMAHRAIKRATEAREHARYVNDAAAWGLRTAYADARTKYAAGLRNSAHSIHLGVHDEWSNMAHAANSLWVAQNLVFLLRSAITCGDQPSQELASRELCRNAPDLWTRYGARMVTPKDGPAWFSIQDVRF